MPTAPSRFVSPSSLKPRPVSYFTPCFIRRRNVSFPSLGSSNQLPTSILIKVSLARPLRPRLREELLARLIEVELFHQLAPELLVPAHEQQIGDVLGRSAPDA